MGTTTNANDNLLHARSAIVADTGATLAVRDEAIRFFEGWVDSHVGEPLPGLDDGLRFWSRQARHHRGIAHEAIDLLIHVLAAPPRG